MFARPSTRPYICSQCLSKRTSRRLYSTESTASPLSSGAAKLTTRRLISLHGIDAPKFLQGIITNHVKSSGTEPTKGFYAAFLTAPGKVLHDSFIYPTSGSEWYTQQTGNGHGDEPGFLVEVDAEQVDVLMKHLKRHKLRSKFKLRVVEDGELNVWSLWKEGDRWTAHGSQDFMEGVIGLTDARAPGMGQRLVLPGEDRNMLEDVKEAPLSAYTLRRYLRGVPEGQKEMPRDDCLPMNCNIDIMGGIDFKKGCYLGQELTIRTHHTGVVRRRALPVALYEKGNEPPENLEFVTSAVTTTLDGADIRRDDTRKRSTGKLIAHIGNIGLGMCRLEQMTDLTISGEPSPFTAEDRFLVQSAEGQDMGLKAFVPDWMRGKIRGPKVQKRVQ